MSERLPVTEADLHAYVDGALPEVRRAEVAAYLATHPEDAGRVSAYAAQNAALHALFDPILEEGVPARLSAQPRRWSTPLLRYAAVVAWVALGGVIGWQLQAYRPTGTAEPGVWVKQAAIAHATYSPEVRHPVEVGADQEAHLVNWLSKRLGTKVRVPHLGSIGYALVGGRLLPSDTGPVAQFMYQDGKGLRLTLYVRTNRDDTQETAFRFTRENNVAVFYWIDRNLGYALSGNLDKAELLQVANTVYRQLNP